MNRNIGIELVERDHRVIVKVKGEVDLATAPLFDEKLRLAEAMDVSSVLVDLDQVAFMDAAGLRVLARLVLDQNGTRYSLTRGSRQVQRLFDVSGLIDRLPFTSD